MLIESSLMDVAPCEGPTQYDQRHLALYAALLDAEAQLLDWREVATRLMRLDPDEGSEQCWRSHLERAKWIIGDGLSQAIEAFGTSRD